MLVLLTRAMRGCAARLLAAVYLLCVLAPAASFAFGDGSRAAHCLTDDDHGLSHIHMTAQKMHVHSNGTSHVHSDGTTQSKHDHGKASADGQCCGLFCFSALPASGLEMALPVLHRGPDLLTKIQGFVDHPPPRLFRPPLSPLPV
jgi:hypothetical protein